MDLIFSDTVLLGVCLDISESGLRGTLSSPAATGTAGLLTLYHDECGYQVHAQIESIHKEDVRIRFCFDSEQESKNIQRLLTLLSPSSSRQR